MSQTRVVVVLDCGEITKVVADHFGTRVLIVNGNDSSMSELAEVRVDNNDVDDYYDHCV